VTVLLTGATGFLGGAILARLLGSDQRVVAIVRALNRSDGFGRLRRSLSRFMDASRVASALTTCDVLVGDLADCATYEGYAFSPVMHVVHAAACTSFRSEREVWRSNVDATGVLVTELARRVDVRRFVYVGTAYACGDEPNPIVIEDDAPRAGHGYVNAYTRSKAEAERLLRARDLGERLVVARPSVVVGHTRLGTRPSSSLFWYYRALAALAAGPFDRDERRDIVPVDWAAEAIVDLLLRPRLGFDTYHVSAGARASQVFVELLASLSSGASPWQRVSAHALGAMAHRLVPADEVTAARLARALEACARFGELGVQYFDNDRLLADPESPRQPRSAERVYAFSCVRRRRTLLACVVPRHRAARCARRVHVERHG
jgi:nucleoside-diphosphate-sugar epimerase